MRSKFKLLALVLLSTTFFLTSCGDSASNPTTPSNQVTDNSTNKPSVPSVNTDKKDDASSDWYASEKEIMKQAFGFDFTIPFADGLTDNRESSLEKDDSGNYFYTHDMDCGDITSAYKSKVEDEEYTYDSTQDGYDLYAYSYDDTNLIVLQIGYSTDYGFEIYAWVESSNTDSNVTEYSSFPYADIATFFNLTSVTNNQIPSFDIASNESYHGYTSKSESSSEFVVYGTIDSSITDSQMETNYSNALKALGYTVTVEDGYYPYAESEEKGFLLSFGCDNSVFFLDIMKYESTTTDPDTPSTPDATIKTITIDANNFDAKYPGFESDLTISGYTFKYGYIINSNDKIQFRNLSKSNSYLFNSTAMNLSTVILNMDLSKGQYAGIPTLYVSSSLLSASSNGTEISPVITDETTYTYTIPKGNSYFKITGNQNYASYMNSIAINLK